MTARKTIPAPPAGPITEFDWNFDGVPDSELAACCLWEYGRESRTFAVSSAVWREIMEKTRSGESPIRHSHKNDNRYLAFLDAYYSSDQAYLKFYELVHYHGGAGSPPWQRIPIQQRTELLRFEASMRVGGPLRLATLGDLECLWLSNAESWDRFRQSPSYKPEEDDIEYDQSDPWVANPGHKGEPHGATIAAFNIDFRLHSDSEISAAFLKWLKEHRPKHCPNPTGQGHKFRDWRAALERLGMMRLLHRYALREMSSKCPAAWKKYERREWYKERKRAIQTFRKLFPFLPHDDLPIARETKGQRVK